MDTRAKLIAAGIISTEPRPPVRTTGAKLGLDNAGRIAAAWHIVHGEHGAKLMHIADQMPTVDAPKPKKRASRPKR